MTRALVSALALVAVLRLDAAGADASRGPGKPRVAREVAKRTVPVRPRRTARGTLSMARARIARSTAFRAVSGKLPTPKTHARAFALGVIEGPWHTVEHLANKKSLAIAIGTTATLGVILHVAAVPATMVAAPVLIGVLAHRLWKGSRAYRAAPRGPERARVVGRQVAATVEITAELAGVHALHPHHEEALLSAATSLGSRLVDLGSAALQGVLGFHELFYLDLRSGKGQHGHEH